MRNENDSNLQKQNNTKDTINDYVCVEKIS